VVDEAIFTTPAHPNWGGTALINPMGELIGLGSLQLEQAREKGRSEHLNMIVPTDVLKPILDDLLKYGRPNRPVRPWLGCYATQVEDKIVLVGLSNNGPAQRANLHTGDIVLEVAGQEVDDLADFFRGVWALGPAGVEVPLTIYRDGRTFEQKVVSGDRNTLLWKPRLH
jgi:S1-C subfamily serine protease